MHTVRRGALMPGSIPGASFYIPAPRVKGRKKKTWI
nr:MAG TPA: hypothetical protein [Caudoviricetes sp.]